MVAVARGAAPGNEPNCAAVRGTAPRWLTPTAAILTRAVQCAVQLAVARAWYRIIRDDYNLTGCGEKSYQQAGRCWHRVRAETARPCGSEVQHRRGKLESGQIACVQLYTKIPCSACMNSSFIFARSISLVLRKYSNTLEI